MKELIDIKYWIFDLDNTLYSGQTKVFSEVDKKMSSFISEKFNVDLVKAKEIQRHLVNCRLLKIHETLFICRKQMCKCTLSL